MTQSRGFWGVRVNKATLDRLNRIAAQHPQGHKVFYAKGDGTYTDPDRVNTFTRAEVDAFAGRGWQVIVVEYVRNLRGENEGTNTKAA